MTRGVAVMVLLAVAPVLARADAEEKQARAFAGRVMEAVELVVEMHPQPPERGTLVEWAVRALHAQAGAKVPKALERRLRNVNRLKRDALFALLVDARLGLSDNRDLGKDNDVLGSLRPMLRRFDPDADILIDPGRCCQFEPRFGVGVKLGKDHLGRTCLISPLFNGPAHQAGLRPGDWLTHVVRNVAQEGMPPVRTELTPTANLSVPEFEKLLLGKEKESVALRVEREGWPWARDVEVVRSPVGEETVLGWQRTETDAQDHLICRQPRLGYVRLERFADATTQDLTRTMERLQRGGLAGLVLDLRFNPGGLLTSAIEVSDLFIDDGLIVNIRSRRTRGETKFTGQHAGSLLDFPMVCLVNGETRRSAEILAAALQDHRRAVVVGERTMGRGALHNILRVADWEVKLPTAYFCRPSGASLDRWVGGKSDDWGVKPDRVVALTEAEREDLRLDLERQQWIVRPDWRGRARPLFADRQLEEAVRELCRQIGKR